MSWFRRTPKCERSLLMYKYGDWETVVKHTCGHFMPLSSFMNFLMLANILDRRPCPQCGEPYTEEDWRTDIARKIEAYPYGTFIKWEFKNERSVDTKGEEQ